MRMYTRKGVARNSQNPKSDMAVREAEKVASFTLLR